MTPRAYSTSPERPAPGAAEPMANFVARIVEAAESVHVQHDIELIR
jgi:hypothetical protein